jgi:hypothetical protein
MERTHFTLWYRLHGEDRYLIWFSGGDRDGVFLDSNGGIPTFPDKDSLHEFARLNNLTIQQEKANPTRPRCRCGMA